jgi:hypothetical protein
MALTLEELKGLFDGEGIKYFVAPDQPALLAGFKGINGSYQVITVLELDGAFMQFRTMNWLHCAPDHPALVEVLKAISDENYTRRMVKFGWDARDGELVAYADVWVEDSTFTKSQFNRMLYVYLPVIDMTFLRLTKAMETGHDPGQMRPEDMLAGSGSGGGLSEQIQALLAEIGAGGGKPPEQTEDEKEDDLESV